MTDVKAHYADPISKPYPGSDEDNPILTELSRYLETAGISDSFTKIYITSLSIDNFSLLVFIFVVSSLMRFQYSPHLGILIYKGSKKESVDATAFVIGIITLLKQFHSAHTQKFIAFIGQYVRSLLHTTITQNLKENKITDYPTSAVNTLLFLEDFCKYSGTSRKIVEGYLPAYLFDSLRSERTIKNS